MVVERAPGVGVEIGSARPKRDVKSTYGRHRLWILTDPNKAT